MSVIAPAHWAESAYANGAAEAIAGLLDAARKRGRTVQWMPEGQGCRFEVIDVKSGEVVQVVGIDAGGHVVLRHPRGQEKTG